MIFREARSRGTIDSIASRNLTRRTGCQPLRANKSVAAADSRTPKSLNRFPPAPSANSLSQGGAGKMGTGVSQTRTLYLPRP